MDAPTHWLAELPWQEASPSPTLPSKASVVVVGGGVMGVATAYWLARAGVDTLLLEAQRLAWGASGRSGGLMLPSASPLERPELLRDVLTREGLEVEYQMTGHLALASSEHIWQRIQQEVAARAAGAPPLYALDLEACEALLGMGISRKFLGGRWYPGGAVIHPGRFTHGLARAAQRYGARLELRTPVQRVEALQGGGLEVATPRGVLRAEEVVYACSSGLSALALELGAVTRQVHGHVLSSRPLPRLFVPGMAVDWGTVYWRQTAGGELILGGNPGELSLEGQRSEEAVVPDIQELLEAFLPSAFPQVPRLEVARRWSGVMDYTLDGRPLVGRLPGAHRRWVLAGFGGHGMPAALGFAQALCKSILRGAPVAELEPFRPDRFHRSSSRLTGTAVS